MSGRPKVTVAGAGVFGLATALMLADADCDVTVVDPGVGNASGVAAGMIAPVFEAVLDPVARSHLDLMLAGRNLWPGFAARAGILLDRSGALAVGGTPWLDLVAAGFKSLNQKPVEIRPETAVAMAPGLSVVGASALVTREDWRLDAPTALRRLAAAALEAGVSFRKGAVSARGDADILIVATGSHPGELAPETQHLSPIKGQLVRVSGPCVGAVVRSEGVYAAPGAGMVFGASMEMGRADAVVDRSVADPLRDAGLKLFPGLEGRPFQISAGVRAATPDGLPMVGASGATGVLVAVGARRNGWLLAPMVAQTIRAFVTGRDPGAYASQFEPSRFRTGREG